MLAAIAHAEVAVVAPFGSADGLVARAVEHMVLIATGVDPLGVVAVEAGHAADPAGYVQALDAYADGTVARSAVLDRALRPSPDVRGSRASAAGARSGLVG